jgi:hypothetical protein
MDVFRRKKNAVRAKMETPVMSLTASAQLIRKLSGDNDELTSEELTSIAEYLVAVAFNRVVVSF